ncbi:MAG: hypothetical protein WKG32_13995 [Gemmatimonadaceae bacterium]
MAALSFTREDRVKIHEDAPDAEGGDEMLDIRRVPGAPGIEPSGVPETAWRLVRRAAAAARAPLVELATVTPRHDLWDAVCDRWVALPPGLPDGSYLALAAAGSGLAPLARAGEVVLVRVDRAARPRATVVVRSPSGDYVAARVSEMSATTIKLVPLAGQLPFAIRRDSSLVVGVVALAWSAPRKPARRGVRPDPA